MGPQNGIAGGDAFGTDLPQIQIDDAEVERLKNTARYAKSKEYKELRSKLESRIEFYQKYLPGGVPPENIPEEERGKYWAIASIVISEFQGVINGYEQVVDAAKDL